MEKEKAKRHFLSLYGMALSDHNIDPRELTTLYEIGIKRGVGKEEINEYVLSAGTSIAIPDFFEDKVALLYDLSQIILADGSIEEEEIALLKTFCKKMEFKDENIDGIIEFLLTEVQKGTLERDVLSKIKA